MVRCSKCNKSYKRSKGKCWVEEAICGKCWYNAKVVDKVITPKIIPKLLSSPTDHYLDRYTFRETKKLNN